MVITYFNVTRPQYMKGYKVDGKFSREEMNRQIGFLSKWKKMPKAVKNLHAKEYATYSANYNYTFGIPKDLIGAGCRSFRDETGKVRRVSVKEIMRLLVDEGFIEADRPKHGVKQQLGEDGKYHAKLRWLSKYPIADKALLDELFNNPKYKSIDRFPIPEVMGSPDELGYIDAKNAIVKWEKKQGLRGDGKTKKYEKVEEEVEVKAVKPVQEESETAKLVKRYAVNYVRGLASSDEVENELRACHRKQKEIDEIISALNKLKKQKNSEASRREEYYNKKKSYLNGSIKYEEFRNWMTANNVLEKIVKQWDDVELQRINERAQAEAQAEAEAKKKAEAQAQAKKLSDEDLDEIIRGMSI